MGIFSKFRKRDSVIDLTDDFPAPKKKPGDFHPPSPSAPSTSLQESSNLVFLGDLAQSSVSSGAVSQNPQSPFSNLSSIEDPKERLKHRLLSMTEQIEELSNQLYKMTQRMELLEQRLKGRTEYLG